MNLLLDTHIFLWWLADDKRLTKKIKNLIAQPENMIFISVISAWEINIKTALGKLEIPDEIEKAILDNGFQMLLLNFSHTSIANKLPYLHRDPFDHMLIAQAKAENFTFVTHDAKLTNYDINIIFV
ncbi:MAG: type II toxin-antitoxin system VapC family toxin [Gammaproteobacteria bacterium]